jgi:DNA polymerase-3 subunit delta
MKIPANRVESFAKNIDKNIIAALVFGPDIGKVSIIANDIAKSIVADLNDPFSVTYLDADKVIDEPSLLIDEMCAIGFSFGRKLIFIKNASTHINNAVKFALDNLPDGLVENVFLLITSDDLPTTSALRKIFEYEDGVAALACYQDDERGLGNIIRQELEKHGIRADGMAIDYLSSACQGNRLVAITEVQKLSLCLGNIKSLDYDTAVQIVGDSQESSIQEICNLVLDGNLEKLNSKLEKAYQENVMPIVLLRSIQRYLERINIAADLVKNGMSDDASISSLKPPVFFKQVPLFKNHLRRVKSKNSEQLLKIYSMLYDAEAGCKETGSNAELITSRVLMGVARA